MGELYILDNGCLLIPARHPWVGGRQNRCTSVEGADDTSLGNGEGLLLHDLVENGTSAVRHLVKLIDAADTIVTENKGSTMRRCEGACVRGV